MNPLQPPLPLGITSRLRVREDQIRQRIYAAGKVPLQNFDAFKAMWPEMAAVSPAFLIFVEMDEMKRLNNEFGHENADRFLEESGKILRSICSDHIYSFHMSGDEFLVVTCGLSSTRVEDLAAAILRQTRQCRVKIGERAEPFTVSMGIASIDPREDNRVARDLAELAVKEAKRSGRNQYVWFAPEMEMQVRRIDYRKDCPHCHTHFSLSLEEEVYRATQAFFCPRCGRSVSR